jgi:hypothetical protein
MDNVLLQKIKDTLSKSNSIGIVVGSNPSLDQMAAALSLYLSLKKVNKNAIVASPTNPIVEISSLVGIDKVQTSLGSDAGDLVVSFPYTDGEIEKVSYTLENNFLNIIVKAGEKGLTFNEQDVRYIRGGGNVDLLFVIGTPRLSDLGELLGGDKLKNAKVINIDNKAENQGYGDIVIVSPKASSVSEQVTEVLVELGFSFDQDVAQNLLSGIVTATDDFRNSNSTSLAFEMAGILMQRGATRMRNDSASTFMPRQNVQPQQVQPTFVDPSQKIQRLEDVEKSSQLQQGYNEQNVIVEEKPVVQKLNVDDKAPIDWLAPKVYTGTSKV